MSESNSRASGNEIKGKPVEKRGFPPVPPVARPPANQDLRFIVNESFQLGMRLLSDIVEAIRIIKQ